MTQPDEGAGQPEETAPQPDEATAEAEEHTRERARGGVRGWVRAAGRRTGAGLRAGSPYGILAFLTASALAPVAAPVLGASGAYGAVLEQLGGMGSGHLADVLASTAARMRGSGRVVSAEYGEVSAEQWRDALAEALEPRLAASDEAAAALRAEVGALLGAVDAVEVALSASTEASRELRRELVSAIAGLGAETAELRGLAQESARALARLQQELTVQGSEQRQQTALTRQSLVAVTELRQEVLRTLQMAWPPAGGEPAGAPGGGTAAGSAGDTAADPAPAVCPYPGLAAFRAEDAAWFSGRDRLVAALTSRLSEQLRGAGPLALVGVSGVGKSSLLRAGLLPAVARGALPAAGGQSSADSSGWPWLTMTPGTRPLRELAGRTAHLAGVPATESLAALRESPDGYGALAAQAAAAVGGPEARLLLVVDQLEELFTLDTDPDERAAFLTVVTTAAPALVVLAVRADFYPQCIASGTLAPVLADGQFVVGPLGTDELREAVTQPARRAGLVTEPGLAELMLTDLGAHSPTGYDPGALPLLAHALRATWSRRSGHTLTVAGYRAAGGITHALTDTAERVYQDLDAPGREAVRRALLAMVTLAEGETVVRRHVPRARLGDDPVTTRVLDTLIAERLVTADEDSVAITHEALLTRWQRLAAWVTEDRQALRLRQQLSDTVREWAASGHDESLLFRGSRLALARETLGGRPELGPREQQFLRASEEASEATLRAERRRTRRLQRLTAGLAGALALAVVAGTAAVVQTGAAREQRAEARSRQYAAESLATRGHDPRQAMQRALDAWAAGHTTEARGALLSAHALTYGGQLGTGQQGRQTAVSPDGELVAVGHPDGRVELFDSGTRQLVGEPLEAHRTFVSTVAFSPDGSRLLTAAYDWDEGDIGPRSVRVWDVPDGEPVRTLPGSVTAAWLPDSRHVIVDTAVVTAEQEPSTGLVVFDAVTGEEVAAFATPTVSGDLAVSPGGELVATGLGGDRIVRVWRWRTGELEARLALGATPDGPSGIPSDGPAGADGAEGTDDAEVTDLARVAFAPDETLATLDATGSLQLWPPPYGERDPVPVDADTAGSEDIAFTGDGHLLVPVGAGAVTRWSTDGGPEGGPAEIDRLRGFPGDVESFAVSADGTVVAAAGMNAPTVYWRPGAHRLPQASRPYSAVFAPDGRRLLVAAADGPAQVWDLAQGTRAEPAEPAEPGYRGEDVTQVAYAPDGRWAGVSGDGTVRMYGPDDAALGTLPGSDDPPTDRVVFSPDGSLVAAVGVRDTGLTGGEYALSVWDASSRALLASRTLDNRGLGVSFGPDADRILVTTVDVSSSVDGQLEAGADPQGVDFEGADAEGRVDVYRTGDLSHVRTLPPSDDYVTTVAVAPGGGVAALVGSSRQVALYDTDDWTRVRAFGSHPGTIRSVAFSPDGQTLATVTARDPVVRLWDVPSGSLLAALRGHTTDPNSVAFSPDGDRLATTGARTVQLWSTSPAHAVDRLCRVLGQTATAPGSALCARPRGPEHR